MFVFLKTKIKLIIKFPNKIKIIGLLDKFFVSDLPELRRIVENYQVGIISKNHDPDQIAHCVKEMLNDPEQLSRWKSNCLEAAKALNWEKEEVVIRGIYERFRKVRGLD